MSTLHYIAVVPVVVAWLCAIFYWRCTSRRSQSAERTVGREPSASPSLGRSMLVLAVILGIPILCVSSALSIHDSCNTQIEGCQVSDAAYKTNVAELNTEVTSLRADVKQAANTRQQLDGELLRLKNDLRVAQSTVQQKSDDLASLVTKNKETEDSLLGRDNTIKQQLMLLSEYETRHQQQLVALKESKAALKTALEQLSSRPERPPVTGDDKDSIADRSWTVNVHALLYPRQIEQRQIPSLVFVRAVVAYAHSQDGQHDFPATLDSGRWSCYATLPDEPDAKIRKFIFLGNVDVAGPGAKLLEFPTKDANESPLAKRTTKLSTEPENTFLLQPLKRPAD